VTSGGPVTLRLKRTVGGRRAGYRGRFLTLRLTVRFTPDGGKPVTSIRNVRVRIRR
jgi:hypothetical protein